MLTASALSAQPSHCWPLMDSAYTRAHTRRKKSFSPLASLWRSSNHAAHSWSLFISKTKALPTTSCLPLMSQRGCSPVFVSDSELEKERNALRPECYRVNIDANCWADSRTLYFILCLHGDHPNGLKTSRDAANQDKVGKHKDWSIEGLLQWESLIYSTYR